MMKKYKILFAGESWTFVRTETKGVDQFSISGYETEIERVKAFMGEYAEIEHIPAHEVMSKFPSTKEELQKYDIVITSDVGANSYLLPPQTFFECKRSANKLQAIADYVEDGGVFGMMGGYMSFTGFQARGNFKNTPIEKILPVNLLGEDDRMEHPEGIILETNNNSPVLKNCNQEWKPLLGYNKLIAKKDAEVIITYDGDPILTIGQYGKGKTFAWASDCAPHWMPADFCESENNKTLWHNVFKQCCRDL
jgi:uncharacterized membrane protein